MVTITLNEHAMKQYRSLENLRKYNGGNFKSQKQADYIATWADKEYDNDMLKYWGFADEHLLQDGEYLIVFLAEAHYGEGYMNGRGEGNRPFSRIYTMDKHGIKRVHKLKYQIRYYWDEYHGYKRPEGWAPVGNELLWERTEITFHPAEPAEPAAKAEVQEVKEQVEAQPEQPVSEWVGEIGKRMEFKAQVVYDKDFETDYGWKTLYIFKDEQGNVLKTFYTGHQYNLKRGQWYTFKAKVVKHDTYKDEKFTLLQRLTCVKEAGN